MLKILEADKRVALRAAEGIRKYGHAKEALWNGEGMCLIGAIIYGACDTDAPPSDATTNYYSVSADTRELAVKTHLAIEDCVKRLGYDFVMDYNNAPERTADEVINMLEEYAFSC